jgi:hypothetical protein
MDGGSAGAAGVRNSGAAAASPGTTSSEGVVGKGPSAGNADDECRSKRQSGCT